MRTLVSVSLLLLAGCSSLPPSSAPSGSIGGAIAYPSESTPDMRICALQDNGPLHACVHTRAGDRDSALVEHGILER